MQRVIDSRRLLADDAWMVHDAREPIPAVGFSIWIEALSQGSAA
mgnify:CR=1 FL=1